MKSVAHRVRNSISLQHDEIVEDMFNKIDHQARSAGYYIRKCDDFVKNIEQNLSNRVQCAVMKQIQRPIVEVITKSVRLRIRKRLHQKTLEEQRANRKWYQRIFRQRS